MVRHAMAPGLFWGATPSFTPGLFFSQSQVLRVNGTGNMLPPSSLADLVKSSLSAEGENAVSAVPPSTSSDTNPDLQHFVTFDDKGREIHFVALAAEDDVDTEQQVAQVRGQECLCIPVYLPTGT